MSDGKTLHMSDVFPSGRDLLRIAHDHTSILKQLGASVIEMQRVLDTTSDPLHGSPLPYDIHQTVLDTRMATSLLCKNTVNIIGLCALVAEAAQYYLRNNPTGVFELEKRTVDELRNHLSRQRQRISAFSASWDKVYTDFREIVVVGDQPTPGSAGEPETWFLGVVTRVQRWMYSGPPQVVDPAADAMRLLFEASSAVGRSLEDLRTSFEDFEGYWQRWARGLSLQASSSTLVLDLDWVAQEWTVEAMLQRLNTLLLESVTGLSEVDPYFGYDVQG